MNVITMNAIRLTLTQLTELNCVESAREWRNGPRIYINLRGESPHHNGDKHLRIYFDKVTRTLHWQKGRGVLSDGMIVSMTAFEKAVGIDLWSPCREGIAIELDPDAILKWYT